MGVKNLYSYTILDTKALRKCFGISGEKIPRKKPYKAWSSSIKQTGEKQSNRASKQNQVLHYQNTNSRIKTLAQRSSFDHNQREMNAALLILIISAAILTAGVVDAAPQSAELARLILQALEMNKAKVEQSDIISAVSRLQEEDQKAANNPYKDFKPPTDHKLPSNGEQGTTGKGQVWPWDIPASLNQIIITSFGGTLVTVDKIYEPEGECVIWQIT